jgi:phage antirepressor YoqD-like protein
VGQAGPGRGRHVKRLREILVKHDVTFQRAKTWKEPNDPDKEAKLDRIEEVMAKYPDTAFAFRTTPSLPTASTPTWPGATPTPVTR